MPEDKLRKYVKKNLERGYSSEEIKEALLNAGYEEEKVNEVITQVKTGGKKEGRLPRNYIYFATGVVVILILMFFFYSGPLFGPTREKGAPQRGAVEEQPPKLEFSCEKLNGSNAQGTCLTCKKIKDPGTHNTCLAVVANRSEGCELAGRRKNSCYLFLAFRTKNKKYCRKAYQPIACQAILEGNLENCKKASGDVFCYLYFAIKQGDSSICNQLEDETASTYCKALATDNEEFCKQISESELRKTCLFKIVGAKQDSSVCEEGNFKSTEMRACKALAERRFSSLDCSKKQKACDEAVFYVRNSTFCIKLPKDMRDGCYQMVVFNKLDLGMRKLYID